MKLLGCAAVLVASALATSACAGGHSTSSQSSTTKTDALQLHESGDSRLSPALRNFIRSTIAGPSDGPISEIDVYGPGSRAALVKASSGDIVSESAGEEKMPFYLIVFHGHFICRSCTGPAGSKPPQGTIETRVWSHGEGAADYGIQSSLPPAVSLLNQVATITLS